MPTILLADDSTAIWRVVELTFADEGVRVISVQNGERAIAQIEADPPDIVLADVAMPRADGYDVASYVKQSAALRHIPVLLLTGAFERIDEEKARATGCDGVLVKPFDPPLLVARVRELLAGERSAALWPADLPRIEASTRPPNGAPVFPLLTKAAMPRPVVPPPPRTRPAMLMPVRSVAPATAAMRLQFAPLAPPLMVAERSSAGRPASLSPSGLTAPPANSPGPDNGLAELGSVSSKHPAGLTFEAALDHLDEAFAKLDPSAPPAMLDEGHVAAFARDLHEFRDGGEDKARLATNGRTLVPIRPLEPETPVDAGGAARARSDMDRWDALTPIEQPSAQPRDALPEFAAVPVAPTPTAPPASQRLKIKVGSNEFDAEGPPEVLQAQFEFFKKLVELESSAPPAPPAAPKDTLQEKTPPNSEAGSIDARLGEIMKAEDDVVSLTVHGLAPGDVILLLLYGQKTLRDHDAVTSHEIRADATATGEPPVNRADRLLRRAQEDGHVIVTGQGRGKRYRLTAEGLSKARELAAALIRR